MQQDGKEEGRLTVSIQGEHETLSSSLVVVEIGRVGMTSVRIELCAKGSGVPRWVASHCIERIPFGKAPLGRSEGV